MPPPRPPLQILLAAPRGFCAGVDRAIKIVELALQKYGAPVYVRHEIVHNRHVVERLKAKGAVFVEELDEIPETGAPVIFSAHGVPKAVPAEAKARKHVLPRRHLPAGLQGARRGRATTYENGLEIVLIGHAGHPEVVGTLGQLPPGAATLIETAADARAFTPRDPERLAYITQTTLSVDDTAAIVAILQASASPASSARRRKTSATPPPTARRRSRPSPPRCDRLIVVGAPNSSNSLRLVEVAERAGCPKALLVQQASDIPWDEFDGIATLGITAGASAPELLVDRDHRRLPRPLRRRRSRAWSPARSASPSTCRASCAKPALPDASPETPAHGRLHRSSPTTSWLSSSPATIWARCCPTRASPRASRTPTISLHTEKGPFFLTLYEKRVAPADLPFFLGLMEHLARPGFNCPTPVHDAQGGALRTLAGRPAALVTFLEGVWITPAAAAPLRGGRRGDGRAASGRAELQRCAAPTPLGLPAGGRCSSASAPAPTRSRRVWPPIIEQELDHLEAHWPADLPQGVIHADLFPDNVFFLGDSLSGADRLLLRLQRRPRLRHRRRAERLVLRDRPRLQHHQGTGAAQGLPDACARSAGASARPCRCWRAARRCASC